MFLLSNIKKLFTSTQHKFLRQLRSIDYQAKRKQTITKYNQYMTQQKVKYIHQIKKYQSLQKENLNQQQQTRMYEQYNEFMRNYVKRLSNYSSQLTLELRKIDVEENTNTVKLYLLQNIAEDSNHPVQEDKKHNQKKVYIPNGMIIKKIYHSRKADAMLTSVNKQILLLGVQKQDQHCFYISKIIDQFNIKNVITMVPPNLPFFIKTEKSYLEEWEKFITNTQYSKKCKFYLNPQPKTLNDICLNKHHIPLIKQALSKSSSFLQNYNLMLQQNQVTKQYEPAPLLTCLFPQNIQKIFFADYPAYEQRRMIADSTSLSKLRQLFQQHLLHIKNGKYNFSAQWLFPKQVLSKKINHLNGIIRAVSQSSEGRSLVLCSAQMAQLISIQWQLSKDGRLNYNYQDNNYYLNLAHRFEAETEQTFIQFIEKLVILDIIMQPIFTKYFVKYKSFPFMCEHTIGGKQNIGKIFVVWMHYYKIYYESLTQKKLQSDEAKKKRKQYQSKFQVPQNIY